jgi:PAS domain S-box-containing protein
MTSGVGKGLTNQLGGSVRSAHVVRHLLIGAVVLAALVLQGLMASHPRPYSQALLLGAVAISAMLGGIGPALFATAVLIAGNVYQLSRASGIDAAARSNTTCTWLLALTAVLIACLSFSRSRNQARRVRIVESLEGAVAARTSELAAASEKLIAETETLRRVIQHTRCILYEAQIEGLPGWEHDLRGIEKRFITTVIVPDESGAQRVLPLEVSAGSGYWDAWKRSRLPEDLGRMAETRARALIGGDQRYTLEFRCLDQGGQVRWLREDVAIEPLSAGRWRAFGVVTDVTEAKRIETALRESEQRFSLFMDSLPGPAFMKDAAGRLVYLNIAAKEKLLARWRDTWLGKTARDLFPAEVADALERNDREVLATGKPVQVLEKIPSDDQIHDYLTNKFIYRSVGDELSIGGVAIDVTEQRRAEEVVQQQKRLLETLINAAPAGIMLVSPAGEWILYNQRFVDIWPLPRQLMEAGDFDSVRRIAASLVKDNAFPAERIRAQAQDDQIKVVEKLSLVDGRTLVRTSVPVHGRDGGHIGRFTFLQDVTDQERDKQRLRQLARELGRAGERERRRVATLLHDDVGQMLSVALMRIETVRGDCPSSHAPDFDAIVDLLQQVVETARSMSVQLSPPVLHEFGLARAIEWLGSHLLTPQGIAVNFDLRISLTGVNENVLTLFQSIRETFVNILKHARATHVIVRASETADALHVHVEDDGAGFNAMHWAQEPSSGNHFGLFNVREQLHGLGGGLEVESVINRFTRIHLWVPRERRAINGDTFDEDSNSVGG